MKNEDLDSTSPTNWNQEIDSSSDLPPLQSFQSEESTPEPLYETKAGSARLNQEVTLDQSSDSSVETTTISQPTNLIYIPDSKEFPSLSNYQTSSYSQLSEFEPTNQRIESNPNPHPFSDQLDLFHQTESTKPINSFNHEFHEFPNQTPFNLHSNYNYFPVSNPPTTHPTFPLVSILHQDENLINNLSTHSTLAPLLSSSDGEHSNQNYIHHHHHHPMNGIPCMINQPSSLLTSYYGPYQSSSPTSHFDPSFPTIKHQSIHPTHLSTNLNHEVGLLYHSNSHHREPNRRNYEKIEEVNSRTVSPLILPNLNSNLIHQNPSRIDGSASTNSDQSVYDRLSSAGSCQASRAGSESFSRSNPSENLEPLHHHHHRLELNKELDSNLIKKESEEDQNEQKINPIQRNQLISNAVQHLTHQVPRRRLTIEQEQVLLKRFSIQEYLSKREMEELAESLKIPTSQLRTWFGNRRSKLKAAARQRAKLEAGMGHLSDAELKSLNKRINGNHPKSKASTSR